MESKLIEANIKLVDKNKLLQRDVEILESILKLTLFYVEHEKEIDRETLLKLLKGEKNEK